MAPRRTISPFQKALEPGSQDSLRPAKKGRPRTAPPPLPPTPHPRNEEDIIGQLEALGHTWAQKFVIQFGAELVNIALDELADKQGLKTQVGWIVFRVRELAQGAPPLGKAPKPDKSLAYLEEYRRRRGELPWEASLSSERRVKSWNDG